MSPIVWTAYKISHLKYDMLPPLADYDHLRNLVGKSFPVSSLSITALNDYVLICSFAQRLDPTLNNSRRHLAFKLIRVFCTSFYTCLYTFSSLNGLHRGRVFALDFYVDYRGKQFAGNKSFVAAETGWVR